MALVLLPLASHAAQCVITLHGLARSERAMRPMARALTVAGYQVVNQGYPSRRHSIENLASMAIEAGLARCRAEKADRIHFVTHSLGGILVRAYLAERTIAELGRVVMLGPPNQGSEVIDALGNTPAVRWLNGPAGLQLTTDTHSVPNALGPVSFELGVIAGTRSINPILSLYLPNPDDGKVSVARAKVEGMSDFMTVPVSHPYLMKRRIAIDATLRFLSTGSFAVETL